MGKKLDMLAGAARESGLKPRSTHYAAATLSRNLRALSMQQRNAAFKMLFFLESGVGRSRAPVITPLG